jgi:hypothetical protein
VYDQDDVINSLWQQFAEALARAKRVLVLGHSLNDSFLLRALIQNVQPFGRIAVTVLEDEQDQDQPHHSAGPVLAKISQNLVNAAIVPMRFRSSPDAGIKGLRAGVNAFFLLPGIAAIFMRAFYYSVRTSSTSPAARWRQAAGRARCGNKRIRTEP